MRPLLSILAVGLVVILAVAFADLQAPSVTTVGAGSVTFEPKSSALVLQPQAEGCDDTGDQLDPCASRFVFAPSRAVVVAVSVLNHGPMTVTLDGASRAWLDQFGQTSLLAKPLAVFDGGDPLLGTGTENTSPAFRPIVLDPGEQRVVEIEFRTTEIRDACQHYSVGTGVIWDSLPIEWHWLINAHVHDIELQRPIEFLAPAEAACSTLPSRER